jgi:hypothetical protein
MQFASNVVDHKLNIQAALEAPRFTKPTAGGCDLLIEARVPEIIRAELEQKGHRLEVLVEPDPYFPEAGFPLMAGRALSRFGRDAQAIFQNPDQVLQFVGACAFLADIFSQSLYLLLKRGLIGGRRSCLNRIFGNWRCWRWSCRNWTFSKQLRWLRRRLERRRYESCGVMNWVSVRGVCGHRKADVARLPKIGHFARVQLIASEGNMRVFAAVVDFNFSSKGIANGAGVRIPRELHGLPIARRAQCDGRVRGRNLPLIQHERRDPER